MIHDPDNRLFLAGLIAGIAVGALAALLARRSAADAPPPLPEHGIQLRRAEAPIERSAPASVSQAADAE